MWCSKGWWIIALITRYRLLLVLFVGPLKPFFGLLVMSPLGFKAKVGSLIHIWCRCMCYIFNEIHLWCDTCHHGGQYGSQAVLFHIPVSRHWWGSKPESIVSPLPHCHQADALLTELSWLGQIAHGLFKTLPPQHFALNKQFFLISTKDPFTLSS